MEIILDASFSLALFLPDEKSSSVQKAFSKFSEKEMLKVPSLWWFEINNVLSIAVRKKRVSHVQMTKIFKGIDELHLVTDFSSGSRYSSSLFEISQSYGLTSYDSAYLELAIRQNSTLATLDSDLIKAARKAGVKILQ